MQYTVGSIFDRYLLSISSELNQKVLGRGLEPSVLKASSRGDKNEHRPYITKHSKKEAVTVALLKPGEMSESLESHVRLSTESWTK